MLRLLLLTSAGVTKNGSRYEMLIEPNIIQCHAPTLKCKASLDRTRLETATL